LCRRRKTILTLAYLALALCGSAYIIISALLGHLVDFGSSGHDAGVDAGHAGHDAGGHDASGDVAYGHGEGGGTAAAHDFAAPVFHFPFFSPLAISALFAFIGAYGLIARHAFGLPDMRSLALAVPLALATAYGVTYVAWTLLKGSRGTSTIRLQSLRGARAEVITPIPAGGIGEVAALVDGERYNSPAREADGREVPRGAQVVVQEMVGTTLVVKMGSRADL
jgi:membrane protein implicated in regulation of membrane protease activity